MLKQKPVQQEHQGLPGWWFQLLWKISVSWDHYSNIWINIQHVSNHQPVVFFFLSSFSNPRPSSIAKTPSSASPSMITSVKLKPEIRAAGLDSSSSVELRVGGGGKWLWIRGDQNMPKAWVFTSQPGFMEVHPHWKTNSISRYWSMVI